MTLLDYSSNLFFFLILAVFTLYFVVILYIMRSRDLRKKRQLEHNYNTLIYITNIDLPRAWSVLSESNINEYHAAVQRLFYSYNVISVGIQSGGLDSDTVYWLIGQEMLYFYRQFKYYLTEVRNRENNPYLYINYEIQMNEWEKLEVEERLVTLKHNKRYFS